jgi:hypothetical protein
MRIRGPLLLIRIHPLGLIRKGYFPNQEFTFLYYFYLPLLNTKVIFFSVSCTSTASAKYIRILVWHLTRYENRHIMIIFHRENHRMDENLTYSLLFLFIINVVILPALLYLFGNKLVYSCQVSVRVNFMFYIE